MEIRTGFFATYEDGRDLRMYMPVATAEDKQAYRRFFASRWSWQRWYLPPGFYKITIEPWLPPGIEPFEE